MLTRHPDRVYQGLLNVLLRLITLLYAEDRSLLPQSDLFVRNYSLRGLYERLRADHERYADTMDHRYGAWHQLLVLFRLVHNGCAHPAMKMPARRGGLFDAERFPFLEGRTLAEPRIPLVPDGTIYRVLEKLLIVDVERLSYRTLDVEHIGSVYETMMGFRMERASGPSIALKPAKSGGAPTTIDLDKLLAEPAKDRATLIKKNAEQKIDGKAAEALKSATSLEALRAALDRKIAHSATPDIVATGSMVLQPSDERRKSGSHYTPRSLTEPIVRKTLEPIFARLGAIASPEQILDLRVCDPAMGSGAFLVEACRQLAQRLKLAWERHRVTPTLPPDEDLDLYAMRMVAQRCLYGVDKNPVAADLAKLSLWLATLARDHAFTFLDHALKCGDSLVGLDRKQIESFHWTVTTPARQLAFVSEALGRRVDEALALRDKVRNAPDSTDEIELRRLHAEAEAKTADVRLIGDIVIASFFSADSDKKREAARKELEDSVRSWLEADVGGATLKARVQQLRADGVSPFHWWLEFPEVLARDNAGFDAFCGNPPFAGKNTLSDSNHAQFPDWLQSVHEESHGNADLVAHFFRRAFNLLREAGCFGFISTKTIRQGDTRWTGLRWICTHEGTIYAARTRIAWPGQAAVIVSVVHITRGAPNPRLELDGRLVSRISAYLFSAGHDEDPKPLAANSDKAFQGPITLGPAFVFDDEKPDATPLSTMRAISTHSSQSRELIHPYIGGEEMLKNPRQRPSRFAFDFGLMSEEEAKSHAALFAIALERVKPLREKQNRESRLKYWWRWGETAPALRAALAGQIQTLMHPFTSTHLAFAFIPASTIVAGPHYRIVLDSDAAFAALQARPHETWARFFSSSLKDDLSYTPSDCFETFPFPPDFETNVALKAAGKAYYEFRADLMVRNDEGLTKTYNRFHNQAETSTDILELRRLHAEMDRAVLDAYDWTDIATTCDFFPDYFETDDDGVETPKSIRYRWPDETRDEVLARLLDLNQKRYDEELRLGLHAKPKSKGARKAKPASGDLFTEA